MNQNDSLKTIFKDAVDKITKTYKIDRIDVEKILISKATQNKELMDTLLENKNYSRSKVYKEFLKKAKKEIYYNLRKYQRDEKLEDKLLSELKEAKSRSQIVELLTSLVLEHASTKERLPNIDAFNKIYETISKDTVTVADIGGGLYPIIFPYEMFPILKEFVWIDKDTSSFEGLTYLPQIRTDINFVFVNKALDEELLAEISRNDFDLVLMLKLVPLLHRQNREIFYKLPNTKGDRILITGNTNSLAKNKAIKHREQKIIREFINLTGREVLKEFETPSEFGYLLGSFKHSL